MTKPEMNQRINSMSPDLAARVHAMVLQGNGASTIKTETTATKKQINAIFEWVNRYGRVVPEPEASVPGLRSLFNW